MMNDHNVHVADNGGPTDASQPAVARRVDPVDDFNAEVRDLRRWVDETAEIEKLSAEWQAYYPRWVEVNEALGALLAAQPVGTWTADQVRGVLYAIARDSEDQTLAETVGRSAEALFVITAAAIESGESASRWQLAIELGNAGSNRDKAISLLLGLVDDSDEYVSRMALVSLGDLRANDAERLAERAWDSGLLYQRIVALSVLGVIESPALPRYLRLADDDGRELVHRAAERAVAEAAARATG